MKLAAAPPRVIGPQPAGRLHCPPERVLAHSSVHGPRRCDGPLQPNADIVYRRKKRDTGRAMSPENVGLVQRWIACFNAADTDAATALVHPDIEWRDRMHAPDVPEVVHGIDALKRLAEQWEAAFDSLIAEVLDYIDADPWVICVSRWEARTQDGMAVEVRSVDAYQVEDGKIKRSWGGYPDLQAAQTALGLAE